MNSLPSLPQAAIVDLDGTMVDTMGDFVVALNAMLCDLGQRNIERAAIEAMVGKGSEHLIRSVLAHVGAPPDFYGDAWRAYQAHYRSVNGHHSEVYPGVIEGLRALAAGGLALACLTNKPTSFAQDLLQFKGLAPFFRLVFGGDSFERKKPDPLPLVRTCEALGLAPQQVLMIGDSSNDARAARAAGCPVVLVTYGYNHGEPICSVDADGFVDSLAQVAEWVRRQPSSPAALP